VFDARILPDFGKKMRFFYSLNAKLKGRVIMADFLLVFAKKVTLFRSPFERLVRFFNDGLNPILQTKTEKQITKNTT